MANNSHGQAFASSSIVERYALTETHEQNMSAKRMKFSTNEISNGKTASGNLLTKSLQQKESVTDMFLPSVDSVGQRVTLRIVESSSQGVTYGCYLSKKHGEMVRGDEMEIAKSRLQNSDTRIRKKVVVGKAITSPVSQESFASRPVDAIPSTTIEKLDCPLTEKRLRGGSVSCCG